jgi:hypothetical protein
VPIKGVGEPARAMERLKAGAHNAVDLLWIEAVRTSPRADPVDSSWSKLADNQTALQQWAA